MRTSLFSKSTLVLLCLLFLISIPGAFSTWIFAEMPLNGHGDGILLGMDIFHWQGSEVLPDEEEEGEGHAHAVLINNLINHETNGLNNPDSYLNEQIAVRLDKHGGHDTLGSMAITQGEALTELFDLNTQNVTFLIHMKSDTLYYIFTTSLDLGEKRKPTYKIGSTISPIYRTTVVKQNGKWVATKTEEGRATSEYYEETQPSIFENISRIPSFDPTTWKAN